MTIIIDTIWGFGRYCQGEVHKPDEKGRIGFARARWGKVFWAEGKVKAIMCERCFLIAYAETLRQAPEAKEFFQMGTHVGFQEMRMSHNGVKIA